MRLPVGAILISLVAGVVLVGAPSHPAAALQHLSNGGFEAGMSGWTSDAVTTATAAAESAHSGAAGAMLSAAARVRISAALPGPLGTGEYTVSAMVRTEQDAQVTLRLASSDWGQLEATSFVDGGGGWRHVRAVFDLPSASLVSLTLIIDAPAADVDDVRLDGAASVTFTPTPTDTPVPAATTSAVTGTPNPTGTPSPTPIVDVIAAHVRNPGFEELDGAGLPFAWERYGGSHASTTNARGGSRAARLSSATTSTKWLHQAVTVQGGGWYVLGGHVAVLDSGVEAAFLRISWYASGDASGEALSTADSTARLTAPAPYQALSTGPVQAPSDARSARVRIMLAPRSDAFASIDVDDVTFSAAQPPPPATATPVSAALPAQDQPSDGENAVNGRSRSTTSRRAGTSTSSAAGTSFIGAPSDAPIVLNEVVYDPGGDAADGDAEWVELYNPSDAAVELAGWALGDGHSRDLLPALTIAPRGFVVIAASSAFSDAYPGFRGALATLGNRIGNGLGNDGDALYLFDPASRAVDAVSWGDNAFALQPAVADVPEGHSIERRAAGVDTDTAEDWVDNERPSPGAPYTTDASAGAAASAGSVQILSDAGAAEWRWLPWALAALSMGGLALAISWRAIEAVRGRIHHQP